MASTPQLLSTDATLPSQTLLNQRRRMPTPIVLNDRCVPSNSVIRGQILSFLPLASLKEACRIHEDWYTAACEPDVWRTAIELQYASSMQLSAWYFQPSLPFCFRSPGVFYSVLHALVQYQESFKALMDEDEFYHHVGSIFGSYPNRFICQFPLLILLLHAPSFLIAKVDSTSRDGYVEKKRYLLLIANAVRWHVAYASALHLPWLIEIYRWGAAFAPDPFDPILLTPVLALLHQPLQGCGVHEAMLLDIVEITRRYLERFASPTKFFHTISTSASSTGKEKPTNFGSATSSRINNTTVPTAIGAFSSTNVGGAVIGQEREIFCVVVRMMEQYRHVESVRTALEDLMAPYGPAGIEELIQCKIRMDTASVMHHVVVAEKRRSRAGEQER